MSLCVGALKFTWIAGASLRIVMDFKDGDATYAVRYWLTDLSKTDPTDSIVRTRVYATLHREGIPLSLPTQAIYLTKEDEARKRREGDELQERLKALRQVPLFHHLTEDERRELAGGLDNVLFAPEEVLTRQGAEAHRLFIIVDGEAHVQVMVNGTSRQVAELRSGDFFGEMGLLTGQPRAATVVAGTEVTCYCVSKPAFEAILRKRPEIAEQISHTLAFRKSELDIIREKTGEEAHGEEHHAQSALLHLIRDFFGLGSP